MSTSLDTVTIRPITGPDEIALFNRLPYTINHELDDDLADKRRRPEWMWVAVRGDRLLARVAWWGRSGDDTPLLLDILDVDDTAEDLTEVAQALYETAAKQVLTPGAVPPEYGRFIPADWRENPDTYRAVRTRMGVLESAGARLTVERLRLEWRPAAGLPTPDRRLVFRPALDTDELVALMTRALDGTLDAHSRTDLAQMSPHEAALKHYEQELATYSSPREWWRIGTLGENGEPVGFVVPARNAYHPVIAYLGVVPEHRGHGYVDGLLAEGTRTLAAEDVPRIRAATDLGNVPMAKAFARAGYVNFERAINMAW
ncbi:GNAT family N-acetyltransferase [Micromonospora sp. NBC_00330]|uniref:GNAT family N-acetyltransferase n=1 Tax=Micromonospora sp. NBC_00330 TaxID=2903585 RepID=UPI002E2ACE33|nr:GNAT family N-acetyltransferase [Micromonospora sp. NBC_00330]